MRVLTTLFKSKIKNKMHCFFFLLKKVTHVYFRNYKKVKEETKNICNSTLQKYLHLHPEMLHFNPYSSSVFAYNRK